MAQTLRGAAEIAQRQLLAGPARDGGLLPSSLNVLLLDDDPQTLDCVDGFCSSGGHRLLRARDLEEALELLNEEPVDLLVSDLVFAGEDATPLLKSLAQAHPRLLSLVVTPFRDTTALLKLINEADLPLPAQADPPRPVRAGVEGRGQAVAELEVAAGADRAAPGGTATRAGGQGKGRQPAGHARQAAWPPQRLKEHARTTHADERL